MQSTQVIRLSLPSKGRLEIDSLDFLAAAGLRVFKPNPRQYQAEVPAFPGLHVIFQRPGDIVVSVRQGTVDFGITGIDVIEEKRGSNGEILIMHDALGFGSCALTLAIPEARARVLEAERRNHDAASPRRILLVSGAARHDQTCPGEMSKTFRLVQLAHEVVVAGHPAVQAPAPRPYHEPMPLLLAVLAH